MIYTETPVMPARFMLLLTAAALVIPGLCAQPITWQRTGSVIEITGTIPEPDREVVVEIRSDRNRIISKLSDRSPADPNPRPRFSPEKEIWFPVIDIEIEAGTAAIARFEEVAPAGHYCLNGNFWRELNDLRTELVLTSHLEHWENALYVESKTAKLAGFALRRTIPAAAGNRFDIRLRCLSEDWSGEIAITAGDSEITTLRIPRPENAAPLLQASPDLNRANLTAAAISTIDLLLRSQNQNPSSPAQGGLYLFYDTAARTWRRSDWVWTWGPAIRFLIDAAEIPELANHYGRERLLRAAREMGEASLRFLTNEPGSPHHGIIVTRFDPKTRYEMGFSGFVSPADAYFLVGWGYAPLFDATGDRRFVDAGKLQLNQTKRLLEQDPVIEQDYVTAAGKWKNWTMDESGFGMEGFAEIYRVTRDSRYQDLGRRYMKSLLDVLERPDGRWDRVWHRNDPARESDGWTLGEPDGKPVVIPTDANTRGLSWAMMGLLASHRLLPSEGYLEKARRLAEHLMEAQRPDGSWTFRYDRPEAEVGISEKGTAIWSLLFYRLYAETRDPRHLETARAALAWCTARRDPGADPNARGGIIGVTPASGVVYRDWYPLICTYTMSFYGNAILAELAQN